MTEQNFQVPPPPPQAPAFVPQAVSQPQAVKVEEPADAASVAADSGLPADNLAARFKLSPNIYRTKVMSGILIGTLAIGVILGTMLFGGRSAPVKAQVPSGLNSIVVRNPDLTAKDKLLQCGVRAPSYPCILYILNHTGNDRLAGSFFEEAARLTGRQEFIIRINNGQYSSQLIKGGQMVQIKIPPLN